MNFNACISIGTDNPKKLLAVIKKSLLLASLVEIRFDFIDPSKIPATLELVKPYMNKSVCTLRSKSEGGKFSGSENERISLLQLIAKNNPYLLDVEFNTLKKHKHLFGNNILVSWHDFKKTPKLTVLKKQFMEMAKLSNNVKIVTMANNIDDIVNILELYQMENKVNLVAFCMGEVGKVTRIMSILCGAPYTYVTLGKPLAPGQIDIIDFKIAEFRQKIVQKEIQ